jgi:hypothetical protein
VDIRDYGEVTDGGDITEAMQATINAFATHNCSRIRIPRMGSSGFAWSPGITSFGGSNAWVVESESNLKLSTTFTIRAGMTLRGVGADLTSSFLPFAKPPITITPTAALSGALDPVLRIANANCKIENVSVSGGKRALLCEGTSLFTVENCEFATTTDAVSLDVLTCFWAEFSHIFCSPRSAGDVVCARFRTEPGDGTNTGLIRIKDFRCDRNGMQFLAEGGPVGVVNFEIYDIIAENLIDGNDLIYFDSSAGNSFVGHIKIIRPEIADALGTSYFINNAGNNTRDVYVESICGDRLINPASDPIKNFVVDHSIPGSPSNANVTTISSLSAGTPYWNDWSRKFPASIDARLSCSPVGLPWVFGTPLAVEQDPANWVDLGSSAITAGQTAPDGSKMAGLVDAGNGARCYTGSHTLAVGDWIIAGAWMRSGGTGTVAACGLKIEVGSRVDYNGTVIETIAGDTFEDILPADGWRWVCAALKITTASGLATTVLMKLSVGATRTWFNPCAILIPAGTANFDDVWAVRLARSLKGGWSSTAVAGDVSVLDHQALKAGVFKATAKTFATLPLSPVAGMMAYITDCNTATWGATAAGGGANDVMVWYNGTNWTVMGK